MAKSVKTEKLSHSELRTTLFPITSNSMKAIYHDTSINAVFADRCIKYVTLMINDNVSDDINYPTFRNVRVCIQMLYRKWNSTCR